jgi:hypothetical protein
MEKLKYHSRKFLNKNKGIAALECNVESYLGDHAPFDATVSITDCSRKITLDFGAYEKKHLKDNLDKLALLIVELTKMQSYLHNNYGAMCAEFDKQEKERNERKKQKKGKALDELQLETVKS